MSVLSITPVVQTSDRDAAVTRFTALLDADVLQQFEIPGSGLTVDVLPGLSILSGAPDALTKADSLVASVFVDSLDDTEVELTKTGWTLVGTLGSPGSVLACDPDGSVFEFVERP